jgi:uncharacterized protein YutE (UPF0331/DUF86 family)
MKLNLDLLRQRAQEIRQSLSALESYRRLFREDFISNQQTADAAKHRLIVTIEAAMSICAHLVARLAHKTPDSYAQCFDILAASKVIPQELADRLGRMARFRNLLVHGYGQVDDGRVWDILQQDLGDLDAFLSEINHTLLNEPQ